MEFFTDITARVAAIRDLTGEVLDAGSLPSAVDRLDDAGALELLALASAVGQMTERLRTAAAGVVARRSSRETGHSGLAQSKGHRSAVSLVQQVTGTTRAEAAKQVRVGESLYDTVSARVPSGDSAIGDAESSDAVLWHAPLGHALLGGEISTAQHDAIMRGLGQPPGHDPVAAGATAMGTTATGTAVAETLATGADESAAAEFALAWSVAAEQLIVEASGRTVEELAKAARFVRDQLDPAGAEERFLARYEARSFRMWIDRDGVTRGSLAFDDLSAAWVRSMCDAALRPRRGGPRFVDPEERARAAELIADPRSNEQLAFDLLVDVLRAGSLADAETVYGARQAGVRLVQVVEEANEGSELAPAGPTYTEDGVQSLPAWVARQRVCTTGSVKVAVDRAGNPLDLGRTQRLYSAGQRVALAVRDGGCRWRECDRPASYCEAHHIDSWAGGEGRTDIDRGILLCPFHHMQLHHGGWRITRDGTDDFTLHDPGGGATALPSRIELRYAWAGVDPPPQRFKLAA